jgi:hypothetical protein
VHVVLEGIDGERHEGHHASTQSAVDEVVAQGEVQQFALPDVLLGERCARFLEVKRIVVGFFDFFRWLMCVIGSFVLTLLLVFVAEELRISEKL